MPLSYEMVEETSTTTGTGSFTLDGATFGMRAFDDVVPDGTEVFYLIESFDDEDDPSSGDFEIGWGTFSSPDQLSRADADVIASSNSNNRVSWSAGTKNVKVVQQFIDPAGADSYLLGSNNLSDVDTPATARTNLGLGDVAVATEGSGNGLDADTIDGVHAAAMLQLAGTQTVTGAKTFSAACIHSGDNDWTGENDFNADAAARFIAPVGADKWGT